MDRREDPAADGALRAHPGRRLSACAYVILAHKAPEQVGRLIDRLSPSRVYLHVDAKVDDRSYEAFAAAPAAGTEVRMLERRDIGWAGWSQVDAYLHGMRAALDGGAEHVVLLSGQDYPLRPAAEIERVLTEPAGLSYLLHFRLPYRLWGRDGGLSRVRYRNYTVRDRRIPIPIPRRMPDGMTPYGGSAFACLSRAAAAHLCEVAERRPDVVRFFKRAWLPVETFMPTVLANSPLRETIRNEGLWHVEWPSTPSKHPELLTMRSLPNLLASARGPSRYNGPARFKLFARKFDASVDAEVLDAIDEQLLARSGVGSPDPNTCPGHGESS